MSLITATSSNYSVDEINEMTYGEVIQLQMALKAISDEQQKANQNHLPEPKKINGLKNP